MSSIKYKSSKSSGFLRDWTIPFSYGTVVILTACCLWFFDIRIEVVLYAITVLLLAFLFFIPILFYRMRRSINVSNSMYEQLFHNSMDSILLCNPDGKIVEASAASSKVFRQDLSMINGSAIFDYMYEPDGRDLKELLSSLKNEEIRRSRYIKLRLKGAGEMFVWVECCAKNLLSDKSVQAFVLTIRNITKSVLREKQRNEFISMAAHELKNPISAIKCYTQLLHIQNGEITNQSNLTLISRLEKQVGRLVTLIDDMLDFAKVKNGSLICELQKGDLNSVIAEAVDTMRSITTTHQFVFQHSSERKVVKMDEVRINQVITNLLSNAIKYSPDGQVVEITLSNLGDQVKCSVRDYGIGIPESKQGKVFNRFYRVDSSVGEKFEGLGLGLYICSQIIKKHHGNMGVESKEGEGAMFWFTLPLDNSN